MKRLLLSFICLFFISMAFADTAYVADKPGIPLFDQPTQMARVVKIMAPNTSVELIKPNKNVLNSGGYAYVRTVQGEQGWIASDYLYQTIQQKTENIAQNTLESLRKIVHNVSNNLVGPKDNNSINHLDKNVPIVNGKIVKNNKSHSRYELYVPSKASNINDNATKNLSYESDNYSAFSNPTANSSENSYAKDSDLPWINSSANQITKNSQQNNSDIKKDQDDEYKQEQIKNDSNNNVNILLFIAGSIVMFFGVAVGFAIGLKAGKNKHM